MSSVKKTGGRRRKNGVEYFVEFKLNDGGGRRTGLERRRFSYASHIPERRSGEDRRQAVDRREFVERRSGKERSSASSRRACGTVPA